MGAKTLAGGVLVLLVVILYGAYREGGPDGVRSWFAAKVLNRPHPRPRGVAQGSGRRVVHR